MTLPAVSVIVVSRGRPNALARCLTALGQLDYPTFEIVVVADAQGCAVVPRGIKVVPFEQANISIARNLGIAQAAGEIVAFIDDDAVAEPTWLSFLCQPFLDTNIDATGGFVLGRNGISYQWKARMAFPDGSAVPMNVHPDSPTVCVGEPGRAIKTEGTNMAFRRARLVEIGAFDPAFAFYLDETDVNMRLAAIGARTAIVPNALVHHGFAPSARRTADRVPRDLAAIGRSLRAFLQKHDPKTDANRVFRAERRTQRNRLLRHMRDGNIMPGDVGRILRSFDSGWNEPIRLPANAIDMTAAPVFLAYETHLTNQPTRVIFGRFWQQNKLFQQAYAAIAQRERVTVFLFSLSIAYHRVYFHPDGFWVQTGGQFGRSVRNRRFFQLWGAKSRLCHEVARISHVRKLFRKL